MTDSLGDKEGQIGAYSGISFNNTNDNAVQSQNFLGIQFDIKDSVSEHINVALFSDQTQVVAKSILLPTTMTHMTMSWSDLGLTPFATFTNVVFQNASSVSMSGTVALNNLALITNPNSGSMTQSLPNVDPNPASGSSAGTLTLHVSGTQIVDSSGKKWMGRGVNIFDTNLDGSGIATAPATAAAEVIRRIDYAVANGADYFRLLLQSLNSSGQVPSTSEVIGNAAYLAALKTIVEHIGSIPGARVELTVDIDPTLSPQIGGQPTSATVAVLTQLVYSFYQCNHVLFGCCNEPAGNATANLPNVLATFNQCVAAVRTAEAKVGSQHHVVVVQGINNYAREVLYYATNPVTDSANNVVYEAHIYDHSADQFWNEYIQASAKIPLICGEFGPDTSGAMTLAECATWQAELETLGTSYTGWSLDQGAEPQMLVDNSSGFPAGIGMPLALTAWGQQFFAALKKAKGLS